MSKTPVRHFACLKYFIFASYLCAVHSLRLVGLVSQEAIAQVEDHIRSIDDQLKELSRSEEGLDSRIEKRRAELERAEKRLATLQSVRPAYMDEYEKLQVSSVD